MTLCRGKFMRYSWNFLYFSCLATESLLDVHAWFYWLIGTCKLPMNLYCLLTTLLARAISCISISDVISSLIRCSVWCWRARLMTKKCLESRLTSGLIFFFYFIYIFCIWKLPSALITWPCMVSWFFWFLSNENLLSSEKNNVSICNFLFI